MKLAAIATILALTGTDAMIQTCCKTTSEKCPGVLAFKDEMEADVDGETFKMCGCQTEEAVAFENVSTCHDDIDAGNDMSISVMAIGVPEVTTTSNSGTCCEIDAVVEPGKLRSSGSSCPINMHSMTGAKGPNDNPLCCDTEDASLDKLEGINACSQMAVAIANTSVGNDSAENNNVPQEGESTENQGGDEPAEGQEELPENQGDDKPAEGQEGDSAEGQEGDSAEGQEGDSAEKEDGESTDNIADSQQTLDESNSAGAASVTFMLAILGAAIQVAL